MGGSGSLDDNSDSGNDSEEDFYTGDGEDFSPADDSSSDDSSDDVIILTQEESSLNQDNLITKRLRSFVFAGVKNNYQALDDEKGLDILADDSYNQSSDDGNASHNETEQDYQGRDNFLTPLFKIIASFTALFKKFLARFI